MFLTNLNNELNLILCLTCGIKWNVCMVEMKIISCKEPLYRPGVANRQHWNISQWAGLQFGPQGPGCGKQLCTSVSNLQLGKKDVLETVFLNIIFLTYLVGENV